MTTLYHASALSLTMAIMACSEAGEATQSAQSAAQVEEAETRELTPVESAEQFIVERMIDGEKELVSIELEETGEGVYEGDLRYTDPEDEEVEGVITAQCRVTVETNPDNGLNQRYSQCVSGE